MAKKAEKTTETATIKVTLKRSAIGRNERQSRR